MALKSLPQLGLVCITVGKEVRYRTTTRKQLFSLELADQNARLHELYRHNLVVFARAVDFCREQTIGLYRIPSNIFPFADTEQGMAILQSYAPELAALGERVRQQPLRLTLHPDQFVVLNSDTPQVIENSIMILQTHAMIMDLLGQPRSPWALIEIHGGKSKRGERLVETIRRLPDGVRLRLALENDEYSYGPQEIYAICQEAGVPMVYDAHHHVVYAGLSSYDLPEVAQMVALASQTWPRADWQLVHISNGQTSFGDRAHHDFISTMPVSYRTLPWIEVEAKQKEFAIQRLQAEWLPYI